MKKEYRINKEEWIKKNLIHEESNICHLCKFWSKNYKYKNIIQFSSDKCRGCKYDIYSLPFYDHFEFLY
jgi:Fe-S-cluster-containing dehydrogenase component